MTNWIDPSGPTPLLNCESRCCESAQRARPYLSTHLKIAVAVLILSASSLTGNARDHGQFGNSTPEMKAWFEGLHSNKGPCCSDADGTAISDADWESKDGHYRVRIPRYGYANDGKPQELIWVDVPNDAVISEPNRVGRTMVWPIWGYMGVTIRCFMPGTMT